jgi:hypothetical protein
MKVDITIEGTTPLICNRFTDEAAEASSGGTRSSSMTTERGTPLEICDNKLYKGLNGRPMIPQPNLLRCLVTGGKFHKIGKTQVTTSKSSMLFSCLDIEGAEIALIHKQPWKVDTRPVRIPSTGGRILCHRPMFDDWKLKFVMEIDTSIISAKLMRRIIDDSGKRMGLGDFRPQCAGTYGRFVVTHWEAQVVDLRDDSDLAEAAE